MSEEQGSIKQLRQDRRNARRHTERGLAAHKHAIDEVGFGRGMVATKDLTIVAGNQTAQALEELGREQARYVHTDGTRPVIHVRDDVESGSDKAVKIGLYDNMVADLADGYDPEILAALLEEVELPAVALSAAEADLLTGTAEEEEYEGEPGEGDGTGEGPGEANDLTEAPTTTFKLAPTTVLDARQGWWQNRKRQWLQSGIKSEAGRDRDVLGLRSIYSGNLADKAPEGDPDWLGVSVFDPVLCEAVYRWYAPPGATILDPFSGGSVRGIVAAATGHRYSGVDLSAEQVAANQEQWAQYPKEHVSASQGPLWIRGDSKDVMSLALGEYDLLFSCPPYADLEQYTDDPDDLSNMDYPDFLRAYRHIIERSSLMLKQDRYAVWVVGDVRDQRGNYHGFVRDTVRAFEDAGLRLYQDAVLITTAATLALRAGRQFQAGRKLGKSHQNVLVFAKGDPEPGAWPHPQYGEELE